MQNVVLHAFKHPSNCAETNKAAPAPSSASAAPLDDDDDDDDSTPTSGAADAGEPDATAVRAAIEDQRTENLEIAWESLEAAIQLFESLPATDATALRVADCRLSLAHLQLEDEVFQGACTDALKALETYEKVLPAYDTHIAETHQVLLAAYLQAVSVEGASEDDKQKAEAAALHHSRQ